ncbi:DUF7227 family protein [Cyanobium sp. ULC082]
MAAAQSHRASLSFPSENRKTGPIAVSSTSRLTCPCSCPLAGREGCYAEAGHHTRLHWDRLSPPLPAKLTPLHPDHLFH